MSASNVSLCVKTIRVTCVRASRLTFSSLSFLSLPLFPLSAPLALSLSLLALRLVSFVVPPSRLAVLSFWSVGYFLGSPIAGYLLQAGGGAAKGPSAYLAAVLYAGALSTAASVLVLAVRIIQSRRVWKKL